MYGGYPVSPQKRDFPVWTAKRDVDLCQEVLFLGVIGEAISLMRLVSWKEYHSSFSHCSAVCELLCIPSLGQAPFLVSS